MYDFNLFDASLLMAKESEYFFHISISYLQFFIEDYLFN